MGLNGLATEPLNPSKTTVGRSWVRPEMQLSVLPEGWPPGPQHARNGPEKKQKSRAKLVGTLQVEDQQQRRTMHAYSYKLETLSNLNVLRD